MGSHISHPMTREGECFYSGEKEVGRATNCPWLSLAESLPGKKRSFSFSSANDFIHESIMELKIAKNVKNFRLIFINQIYQRIHLFF